MKAPPKKFLIRADASQGVGAGHLVRTMALAEQLKDWGHEIEFVTVQYNPELIKRLNLYKFKFNFLEQGSCIKNEENKFIKIAKDKKPDWVVLDGYNFNIKFEAKIKEVGCKILKLSDFNTGATLADILLDQNHGAEDKAYQLNSSSIALKGLRNLVLRSSFRKLIGKKVLEFNKERVRLIISLGGGSNVTDAVNAIIMQALGSINRPNWTAIIMTGLLSSLEDDQLNPPTFSAIKVKVVRHCDSMAEEMLSSDVGIFSGGTTMWEALSMKLPFLGISLNLKQKKYLDFLEHEGLCVHLGLYSCLEAKTLKEKIENFALDL